MKNLRILLLAAFALVATNIFAEEVNISWSSGQYITSWTTSDFTTINDSFSNTNFSKWLTENGHNPADYIKHDVDVFYIEFFTATPTGEQEKASGYICVPNGVTGPMPIAMHFYGTKYESIHRKTFSQALWSSKGFITFIPNYLGENKSAGKVIHPYLMSNAYGQIAKNMLAAGKDILTQNEIAYTNDLLFWGNSEGGYAVLDAAKMFQNEGIPVTLAVPSAGPYDIGMMLSGFVYSSGGIASQWIAVLTAVKHLMAATSYAENTASPNTQNLFSNENYQQKVKANMKTFLREPFASEFIDAYLDIENKGTRLWAIEEVYNALPEEEKDPLFWGVFLQDLEAAVKNPQGNHPFLQFYAAQNSMMWSPQMPVLLTHGGSDINVPLDMSLYTYQMFTQVFQAPNVNIAIYPGLDHNHAMYPSKKDAMDMFLSLIPA